MEEPNPNVDCFFKGIGSKWNSFVSKEQLEVDLRIHPFHRFSVHVLVHGHGTNERGGAKGNRRWQ